MEVLLVEEPRLSRLIACSRRLLLRVVSLMTFRLAAARGSLQGVGKKRLGNGQRSVLDIRRKRKAVQWHPECGVSSTGPRKRRTPRPGRQLRGDPTINPTGSPGGLQPFTFPAWLQAKGLDSRATGIVLAVPMFIRLISIPSFARLADRRSEKQRNGLAQCGSGAADEEASRRSRAEAEVGRAGPCL
jgi:hypothetical protein